MSNTKVCYGLRNGFFSELLLLCVLPGHCSWFYWALTTSLRKPAETFTVAGLGVPYLQFQPTLENWRSELKVPRKYPCGQKQCDYLVYKCDFCHNPGNDGRLRLSAV